MALIQEGTMKNMINACVLAAVPFMLFSADISVEGTYTTSFQSSSAKTFSGNLQSKGGGAFEGDIIAPWNGKPVTYNGTLTLNGSSISGKFVLTGQKRTFSFSGDVSGGTFKGDAIENGKAVGKLDMRLSGGEAGASGGIDYAALTAGAVSANTGIKKETVEEFFKDKRADKNEVIAACAAAEVSGGDVSELYKKRKKVNINYEFLRDLGFDKEQKAKFEELVGKIKKEIEDEKNKK